MSIKSEIHQIHIWTKELIQGDFSLRSLFLSIFQEKDKIMFTQYDGENRKDYSYGAVEQAIYAAKARILEESKLKKGEWIAINADNKVIWAIAFWASLLAGYKVFLLNPKHLEEHTLQTMKQLGVTMVVGDLRFQDYPLLQIDPKERKEDSDLSSFEDEVALASSGTSSTPKVAIYSGRKIIENVRNYDYVLAHDDKFIRHKGKQHSQLVTLPFYHIFAFMLSFIWYSFSHSRFVLPQELAVSSIQPILAKDHIDMILSVPLLFDKINEKMHQLAKASKKEGQLQKLLVFNNRIQQKFPYFGTWLVRHLLAKSLRKKTLGYDVRVLGIGGAKINEETLFTLNGLGYRAIVGYGTTELSVFLAAYGCDIDALNSGTIGNDPWRGEYRFDENGALSLRVPTCCDYVIDNGKKILFDTSKFIPTGDIGHVKGRLIYIDAREDDLLVLPSGEKIFPNVLEKQFSFLGSNQYCILNRGHRIALIYHVEAHTSNERLYELYKATKEANRSLPVFSRIQEIRKTRIPLPLTIKQEVNRRELAKLLQQRLEDYPFISSFEEKMHDHQKVDPKALQIVKQTVASVLEINDPASIKDSDDFFADLGGDSLSFMELTSRLNQFGTFQGDKARMMEATSIIEVALQYVVVYNGIKEDK